jgi:hypothetical protein
MVSKVATVATVLLAYLPTPLSAFGIQPHGPVIMATNHRLSSLSQRMAKEEEQSTGFSQELMDEASDALASVGWSAPSDDAELTSDDPFVRSIDASIQRDMGVSLDELLNPAKVCVCVCALYVGGSR